MLLALGQEGGSCQSQGRMCILVSLAWKLAPPTEAGSFLPRNQALQSSLPLQGFSECKEHTNSLGAPLQHSPDLGGGKANKLLGDAKATGPGTTP